MNYYDLQYCEHAVKNPMVCFSDLKEHGLDAATFARCEKFDPSNDKIKLFIRDAEDDGDPDDGLQNTDMLPVFSPRLIKALEASDIRGVQYVPISVEHYNKEKLDGFCIANVLNFAADALDIDKSFIMKDDFHRAKFDFIWTYAIYASKVQGLDIFRIKLDKRFTHEYSRDIIVSQKFKDVFVKNKFTGYAFKKVITTE